MARPLNTEFTEFKEFKERSQEPESRSQEACGRRNRWCKIACFRVISNQRINSQHLREIAKNLRLIDRLHYSLIAGY
jgi:hypothetical protein